MNQDGGKRRSLRSSKALIRFEISKTVGENGEDRFKSMILSLKFLSVGNATRLGAFPTC